MSRTVCFTGHRVIAGRDVDTLVPRLDRLLERMYEKDFRSFRCGGALGFDTLCAKRVLALKERHPDAVLELILPCADQDARWTDAQKAEYRRLIDLAGRVTVLYETYVPWCMQERNRKLVTGADLCVAYLTESQGGTAYTVKYAEKCGVPVVNLAKPVSRPEKP